MTCALMLLFVIHQQLQNISIKQKTILTKIVLKSKSAFADIMMWKFIDVVLL